VLRRNDAVEQEREVAMRDLEADNSFRPLRAAERGRTVPGRSSCRSPRAAGDGDSRPRRRRPLRRSASASPASAAWCANTSRSAIRTTRPCARLSAQEIETIDMARRAIHDRATRQLLEALEGKVETDFATARRLFTLLCVLHIKA
jgi:uncharacterized protein (UPF0262 family)